MDNFYDNVCDIHIVTEGHRCGYMVRVEYADDDKTEVYHVSKHDLLNVLRTLHDVVTAKGDTGWQKVWPEAA